MTQPGSRDATAVPTVAIDTNCLVAALTKPHGACARLLAAWRAGRLEVVASEATVREAELVLGRWLAQMVGREEIRELLGSLRTRSRWVERPARIPELPLKDPGDRRVVETAVAGNAEYVVTTDREFLSHRGFDDVEFITPDEALDLLEGE